MNYIFATTKNCQPNLFLNNPTDSTYKDSIITIIITIILLFFKTLFEGSGMIGGWWLGVEN